MRVGLDPVPAQVRAPDKVSLPHLKGTGERGDNRAAVKRPETFLDEADISLRDPGQPGQFLLRLAAPPAQDAEPGPDRDLARPHSGAVPVDAVHQQTSPVI